MPPRPNEARREQLLDELEALIMAEGFAQLRVGKVADKLHCSRSTLYKLAPSKEELIALVVDRMVRREIQQSADAVEALPSATEKMREFSHLIDAAQTRGSADFWRDVRDHSYSAEVFQMGRVRGWRVLQGFIDEGIASGEFRDANSLFVAYALWTLGALTRDPDVLEQLGVDRTSAVSAIIDLFVEGVRTRA